MLDETARTALRDRIREAAAALRAPEVLSGVRELMAGSQKLTIDASFAASMVERVADGLVSEAGVRRIRTFLVRSVTLEPVLPMLKAEAAVRGLLLELQAGGYGSYIDDLMNRAGALARYQPELVLVVLDLEDLAGGLPDLCAAGEIAAISNEISAASERVGHLLKSMRNHTGARIVLQGCVVPDRSSAGDVGDANLPGALPRAVERLNEGLADACRALPDCVFFDVDRIAARVGRSQWRDHRLFLATRLPVAPARFAPYVQGLVRSAATLFRAPRKVLCTDLDNTLWGGILGEEGPNGIATGSAFPGNCYLEYQRYLKQLAGRGVLLAVVSKNNPADVEEAFALRSADLALGLKDFVATKIGWGEKAESLRQLASELSLGLDSFVFVDDNPTECEAIRQHLPDVAVIGAPVDEPWRLVEMLSSEPFFDSARVTDDDRRRSEEYRAQAARAESAGAAGNREDFLGSLGIVCTFLPVEEAPLARAVQLLGKTNQFNLTTRRHSAVEVERFATEGIAVAVRVRDRFGDAGVVGLALADLHRDVCSIDSLLLSCRVIGRGIESALLAEVAARARSAGARLLTGDYIATPKNGLCAEFYSDHGFSPVGAGAASEGALRYQIPLTTTALESPRWLTLEGQHQNELANCSVVTS